MKSWHVWEKLRKLKRTVPNTTHILQPWHDARNLFASILLWQPQCGESGPVSQKDKSLTRGCYSLDQTVASDPWLDCGVAQRGWRAQRSSMVQKILDWRIWHLHMQLQGMSASSKRMASTGTGDTCCAIQLAVRIRTSLCQWKTLAESGVVYRGYSKRHALEILRCAGIRDFCQFRRSVFHSGIR